ncbi:MAG TPA: intradiol ring-cleavage dioxygenase [Gemmatimonadales bacterium]|nr:intradiol ring-cleavage dioxygenase [Gemmatimonadales bacterium]
MDQDDLPVGRVLGRRETLGALGASGLALLADRWLPGWYRFAPARPAPGCVVRPEQMEGPYFVDGMLDRSDIRGDPATGEVKPGTPLALTLAVSTLRDHACAPLAGAHVDIWHCDALGVYSGVKDPHFDTTGHHYLRGWQRTDRNGEARFRTIYPGWYPGRSVHIHFKVRTDPDADRGQVFTSQLYFDDALTTRVHRAPPYSSKDGRRAMNADDEIYADGGDQLMLAPERSGDGWAARFEVALQA